MGMILLKSILVGCLALVLALILIFTLVPLFGEPFQTSMFVSAVVGCYTIGTPVAYFCFRQSDRLREALAELERTHAELTEKASRDHMTGLLNRENLFRMLEQRRRASDHGTLLIIDIDHFKRINDSWGHLVGDEALIMVTRAICASMRAADIAGRIGGEEFAVYLPATAQQGASRVAERIRNAVERINFHAAQGSPVHLSVSIGGTATSEGMPVSDVIRLADRRLYEAKRRGRNCIVMTGEAPMAA